MAKKTIEQAAKALKEIKAEVCDGVIRDYKILPMLNLETGKESGFAVNLTLSSKYDFVSTILDSWQKRLKAHHYIISVKNNQLRVQFRVLFSR